MIELLSILVRARHADSIRESVKPLLGRDLLPIPLFDRIQSIWRLLPVKEVLLSMGLVLVMVLTALGVVYSSHISRELFAEQALLQERNDQLQLEWAQLLLEQSAFTSPGQIESVAAQELDMVLPDVRNIELVK
jgi:cell division protein FtsL